MKYEAIKRKLITESSVTMALLAVIGALTYFLGTIYEESDRKKNEMQTQVASVTNERQSLENKYQKIHQNFDLYRYLMEKNQTNGLSVDRQILRAKVEEFKTRYFLNDLSITMGPVQELTGSPYRYKSSVMVASELTIDFDTLTDEDIFSFTKALEEELPGGLKITRFTLSRESKVTDEALRTIAKDGQFSMVKGEVRFRWLGIKSLTSPEKKEQQP